MSIEYVSEKEQQLTHYLTEMTKALELMRQERDAAYERAAVVCEDVTEPVYYGYENPNSFQEGTFACAIAIRAMKGKS